MKIEKQPDFWRHVLSRCLETSDAARALWYTQKDLANENKQMTINIMETHTDSSTLSLKYTKALICNKG